MIHTFIRRVLGFIVLLACASSAAAQDGFSKAKLAWTLPWDDDWVTAVTFVGNNRIAAGNNLGQILVWDLPSSMGEKAPAPSRHLQGHANCINRLLATPDDAYVLSASNDHTIRVWDMRAEPSEPGVVVLNARAVDDAVFRKKKAVAPEEAKVKVQKPHKTLEGHKDWVLGLGLTRDGTTIFSGDDKGQVIVWDRASGKELRRWQVKGWVWALAVDPEGKSALVSERVHLVFDSGRHSGVKLWDAVKGTVKTDLDKEFKGQMMAAAAFSPDGKWVAVVRGGEAGGQSGKVTILEAATGKKVRETGPGHLDGATDVVFHPDGKHIFSAGRDTTVKAWRLEDGKHLRDLGTPRGGQFKDWIHSVAVSPDGRWLAAADMAGKVLVWALSP